MEAASEMTRRSWTTRFLGLGVGMAMTALAAPTTAQGVRIPYEAFVTDAKRLVPALGLVAGQTIADIGAGNGQLTVELARVVGPSGRVYATEINADRLRAIRRASDSVGLANVAVVEGHATRTNLPEGCCDALVVRFVYHHFGEPRPMNASLRQSLKPGGRIAIIDFAPPGPESKDPPGRGTGDYHGVTPATVVRELREAGFEVLSVEEGTETSGFIVVARRPPQ